MNPYRRRSLVVLCLLSLVLAVSAQAQRYSVGSSIGYPTIYQPDDGADIPAGVTITLKCYSTYDYDYDNYTCSSVYDGATITWTAKDAYNNDVGTWIDDDGTTATWTTPAVAGPVTIYATADDNPYYLADDTARQDSLALNVVKRIYVDGDATGNNDGSSWDNAFNYLQDGIDAASSGWDIWVAEGTYYPDEDTAYPSGTNSQSATFTLESGVAIYGGFDGTEDDLGDRDPETNETILSGDINGGGLDSANSRHVVTCTSGSSSTRLDGFTVTMGYADYGLADGGGIRLEGCSPTIFNCLITANKAYSDDGDGGGMSCLNASPTVTNCDFTSNIADDDGGALVNKNGSNGTFTNCTFSSNSTTGANGNSHGGAIYNSAGEQGGSGSSPTFNNCTISSNTTIHDGGGVANGDSGTNPTFNNCSISSNSAGDDGGGVANRDGCSGEFTGGTTISGNAAGDKGGGVACLNSSSPDFDDCVISNNTTPVGEGNFGGGVYCSGGSPSFTECTISGNTANDDGGGVALSDGADASFSDCDFTSNRSKRNGGVEGYGGDGGGIYIPSGCDASFDSTCTFTSNTAEDDSGAAYVGSSSPTFSGCSFTSNSSYEDGGAVSNKGSSCTASYTSCTFTSNTAGDDGGAMCWKDGSHGSVSGTTTFSSNSATNNGGAVFISAGDEYPVEVGSSPSFSGCTFEENSGRDGGAISCKQESDASFSNCDFTENTASDDGGAIHMERDSDLSLSSCTFEDNEADGHGGAINIRSGCCPSISGCTIGSYGHGNTSAKDGGGIHMEDTGTNPTVSNTSVRYNYAGDDGGGLAIKGSSDPSNAGGNTITNNTAVDNGANIFDPGGKW
jgi:predicted outer membrane repeat protein/parallel beta-helix repeat protein